MAGEVHAADLLGPAGDHGHLDHREGGGVGGEDGVGTADAVELAEQGLLDLEVLDHGFDHEVAAGEIGEVGGGGDPGERGIGVGLLAAALLDLTGQRLGEAGDHGLGALE